MVSLPSPPPPPWPSFWQLCLSWQPWTVNLASPQWGFEWAAGFVRVGACFMRVRVRVRVGARFVRVRVGAGCVRVRVGAGFVRVRVGAGLVRVGAGLVRVEARLVRVGVGFVRVRVGAGSVRVGAGLVRVGARLVRVGARFVRVRVGAGFVRVRPGFVEYWGYSLGPRPPDPSHGQAHPLSAELVVLELPVQLSQVGALAAIDWTAFEELSLV
jgi:hypothetical protein